MTLRIKDWAKFQHFKDRKPPWIKLYRDLLDDLQWHEMTGDDAKTLVMLWLIASENGGELPPIKEIAFRLRCSEKSMKSTVSRLLHWLRQDDIDVISDRKMISTRYHDDIDAIALARSRETETETETEEEREAEGDARVRALPPELVADYLKVRKAKRAGEFTPTAIDGMEREAALAGLTLEQAMRYCCEAGWQGFNAKWFADRQSKSGMETAYERSMREKVAKFAPGLAAKSPSKPTMEVFDVAPRSVG